MFLLIIGKFSVKLFLMMQFTKIVQYYDTHRKYECHNIGQSCSTRFRVPQRGPSSEGADELLMRCPIGATLMMINEWIQRD